jgi:hypothetical protein
MTTRSRARIYRRAPKPLARGACPQCTRRISISPTGRRRHHVDLDGQRCTGGGVHVGDWAPVVLDALPPVVMPPSRNPWSGRVCAPKPPDPRDCECGQRPRRKADGQFAAHRVDLDNPVSPYCPHGAPRSR